MLEYPLYGISMSGGTRQEGIGMSEWTMSGGGIRVADLAEHINELKMQLAAALEREDFKEQKIRELNAQLDEVRRVVG
jgi:hypothetical protein